MSSSSSYANANASSILTHSTIQSALFSSVLSTSLVDSLSSLREDPLDAIQNVLLYQTLVMQNRTVEPYIAPAFSPPPYAVAVNTLFFASLSVTLVTAFLCMLVKGWVRALDRKLWEIPDLQKRAVIKELREQGLLRWRLPELIAILPFLVHLSLLLFVIGLTVYLFYVHKLPASLPISILGIGVLVYALLSFLSIFDDSSPYQLLNSRPLDVHSSPVEGTISRRLVSVLNKIWTVSYHQYDPSRANDLFRSILPYLDDLKLRLLGSWHPSWSYDASSFSTKEIRCLAHGICMQWYNNDNAPVLETLNNVIEVLIGCSDPWSSLVASFLQVRLKDATLDLQKSPIAECEADILHAISNVDKFTADQWCFSLSSISTLFARRKGFCGPEEVPAVMRLLARLLQKGLYHEETVGPEAFEVHANEYIDFWLYIVMSVLDDGTPSVEVHPTSPGGILHARDIETCANGMTRDTNYIRQLLQLSHDHKLDASLMRGCLVSILYILVSLCRRGQQEISLVNQYLEIIEEMDLNAWNVAFSELLTSTYIESSDMSAAVLCLLRGELVDLLDDQTNPAASILREYDLKLSAAGAQLTTSTLKVMDGVIPDRPSIIGLVFQNPWLSLYAHNRTRLPYNSATPDEWPRDYFSIASDRLGLYYGFDCLAESNLVNFFLTCPSASIACRALHWYLDITRDDFTSSDIHDFISFPTIFQKGLSVEENRESWLLLVEELVPILDRASVEGKTNFVEAFFGYKRMADQCIASEGAGNEETLSDPPDMETLESTPASADGLAWMEDVWTTVLRRRCPIRRVENNWLELSGVIQATYPEPTEPKELTSLPDPSTSIVWENAPEGMHHDTASSTPKPTEERPEDSDSSILRVLVALLEAGGDLMPVELLDRLRTSILLLDEDLHRDTKSLCRIKAKLDRNRED